MQQARASLSGKWKIAIGGLLILVLIAVGIRIIPILGPIAGFVISGPLALGATMFWLAIARGEEAHLSLLFKGFDHFVNAFLAFLLMLIFILLWSLLLIVPGIIAGFSYAMTFFILADDPSLEGLEAIKRSKAMMKGNRMKLFLLSLRFIGWTLLCILTLGIGFLWLAPYMKVSSAKFYEDIKDGQRIA